MMMTEIRMDLCLYINAVLIECIIEKDNGDLLVDQNGRAVPRRLRSLVNRHHQYLYINLSFCLHTHTHYKLRQWNSGGQPLRRSNTCSMPDYMQLCCSQHAVPCTSLFCGTTSKYQELFDESKIQSAVNVFRTSSIRFKVDQRLSHTFLVFTKLL